MSYGPSIDVFLDNAYTGKTAMLNPPNNPLRDAGLSDMMAAIGLPGLGVTVPESLAGFIGNSANTSPVDFGVPIPGVTGTFTGVVLDGAVNNPASRFHGMSQQSIMQYAIDRDNELFHLRMRYAELQASQEEKTTAFNFLRRQLKANGHDPLVIDDLDHEQLVRYMIEISGGFIHDLS